MGQLSIKWMPVSIATALHFLVDGLCVCLLYLMTEDSGTADLLSLFLTYNILAFMTQPLTGWWVDRLGQRQAALLASAGLLVAAVALCVVSTLWQDSGPSPMMAVAILLGMGNSTFHVWGGKLTAALTANDMRALGVFVSTGVLGLTIGILYASWWLLAGMLLCIILLGIIPLRTQAFRAEVRIPLPPLPKQTVQIGFWILVILTFVLLRSFVGELVQTGLEKSPNILLLLAVTAMTGKACGGWMARWWGIGHAITACVGITAVCMMWKGTGSLPPLSAIVLGVFAINCTMPMTLHLANRLLPWREGFSFGLLAAVLLPGYIMAKSLHLSSGHHFMLSALLLTIAIEVGMLMLMGERRKGVLTGAVAVNILTNVPLNYLLLTFGNSTERIVVGELLVLLVEALWYFFFVRQWRTAAIYSLLCNATSFLAGILIQYIIIYYSL